MKIGMITMEKYENRTKGSVGSSRIRGDWLVKYWNECEVYSTGVLYDGLIFQKAYWQEMMSMYKGIKVFDLCDPDWLDFRPVVEVINNCDGVVTSTESLAEQIRKFDIGGKPVICIPDRVDLEGIKRVKPFHSGRAERVVYFGYSHNAEVVLPAALDGLKRRGLKLTVISDRPFYGNDSFVHYDPDSVNDEIISHDIVLLPKASSSNYRHQFKSNNKIIQAWALGMPVATNGEELDRFLDPDERNKERELRLKEVKEKWDVKLSVEEWKKFMAELVSRRGVK